MRYTAARALEHDMGYSKEALGTYRRFSKFKGNGYELDFEDYSVQQEGI